jgi:hypothetical protein
MFNKREAPTLPNHDLKVWYHEQCGSCPGLVENTIFPGNYMCQLQVWLNAGDYKEAGQIMRSISFPQNKCEKYNGKVE